jgi:hypothetical protein
MSVWCNVILACNLTSGDPIRNGPSVQENTTIVMLQDISEESDASHISLNKVPYGQSHDQDVADERTDHPGSGDSVKLEETVEFGHHVDSNCCSQPAY